MKKKTLADALVQAAYDTKAEFERLKAAVMDDSNKKMSFTEKARDALYLDGVMAVLDTKLMPAAKAYRRSRMKKPTPAMAQIILNLGAGKEPLRHLSGRSAIGGASWTMQALIKGGYCKNTMEGLKLTEQGQEALEALKS